ncbi:hypothetical protein [Endozoicomonas ascidiicola]|uniref:hypothetical protein n=1 Tax=Endozoicomonas ascidiicola TaxID=1698521 RepID=UPI0008308564|nr:hypothetical protein [Endozoicomonas ascidiicola]
MTLSEERTELTIAKLELLKAQMENFLLNMEVQDFAESEKSLTRLLEYTTNNIKSVSILEQFIEDIGYDPDTVLNQSTNQPQH